MKLRCKTCQSVFDSGEQHKCPSCGAPYLLPAARASSNQAERPTKPASVSRARVSTGTIRNRPPPLPGRKTKDILATRRRGKIIGLTVAISYFGCAALLGVLVALTDLDISGEYKAMFYRMNRSGTRLVKRRLEDQSLETQLVEVYKRNLSEDDCKAWLIDRG